MKLVKILPFLLSSLCSFAFSNSVSDQSTSASKSNSNSNSNSTELEKQIDAQKNAATYPSIINLYRPNYILPYYQTHDPFQSIYLHETPNNQKVQKEELNAQISFYIPIFHHLIKNKPLALNFAYTQLMFWQVYAKSQYFRETNYEPELFIENYFNPHFAAQIGIDHQSNGRGGYLERSWNRAYLQAEFSGSNWLTILRGWALVEQTVSSNLHNPNIAYFLGYENVLFSYKVGKVKASLEVQNIESGLSRGFVQVTASYPILKAVSIYALFFNGYGQSLIEYDHKCTSLGVGVTINDWIS